MMGDPVEFVSYIFDRYAFLGLEPTATAEEVKAAIKQKRIENHPDSLRRAGKELKAKAEQITALVAECENMLIVPEKRAFFDAQLADFETNRPLLISPDGTARSVLTGTYHLDPSRLLGQGREPKALIKEMSGLALGMTQADPAKSRKLRKLLAKNPDDRDLRDMLRQSLLMEYLYVSTMEEMVWQKVGVNHHPDKGLIRTAMDPAEYAEQAMETLDKVMMTDVPQQFAKTLELTRIGMAPQQLLLAPPRKELVPDSHLPARLEDITVGDLVAQAKRVVDAYRDELKDLADQKQALLVEIVGLLDVEWVTPEPRTAGRYTLLLLIPPKGQKKERVMMALEGDDHTRQLRPQEVHEALGKTLPEVRKMHFPHDVAVFRSERELGFLPFLAVGPLTDRRLRELGLADDTT